MKTMLFYELKKMFGIKKAIALGVISIIFCSLYFASEFMARSNTSSGPFLTPEQVAANERQYDEFINNPDNYLGSGDERMMKPDVQEEHNKLYNAAHFYVSADYIKDDIAKLQETLTDPDISHNEKLLIKRNIEMLSTKGERNFGNLNLGTHLFYDYFDTFLRSIAPLLLGFLIILLIAPIFSTEYSTKMDGLILSAKHGKRRIVFAKLLAAVIGITAVIALIAGTYILLCGCVLGFSGGNVNLEGIFNYWKSPYDLTVLQYFFISIGFSYIACIGFGIFTLFVSSKSHNNVIGLSVSLVVFYIPLLFYVVTGGSETGIINFTYLRIMKVSPLFERFTGVVIFGHVVMLKTVLLLSLTVVTILFGALSYLSFRRRQVEN